MAGLKLGGVIRRIGRAQSNRDVIKGGANWLLLPFFCVLRIEQLPPRSRSIVRAAHARAHVKTSFRPRHVTDRFGQTFFSLPRCHLCKPTLLFFCCVCSRLSCKLIKTLLGKKKTQKITSLKQQQKNGYVMLVLICFQFGNYPRPRPNHWHH